jgi:hypothetical protein
MSYQGPLTHMGVNGYLYAVSLEGGADEEAGDVSESGRWYGLMRGSFKPTPKEIEYFELDRDEVIRLRHATGAIISQDDQGFLDSEIFDNESEMEDAWSEIMGEEYPDDDYYEGDVDRDPDTRRPYTG